MSTSLLSEEPAVRTVLHLSPAVAAAAMVQAQRRGLRLQRWLDSTVTAACLRANQRQSNGLLHERACVELFAQVATRSPELLVGRWRLLFERVRLEPTLWDYPVQNVEQAELDPDSLVVLNVDRLLPRWPELVCAAFAL